MIELSHGEVRESFVEGRERLLLMRLKNLENTVSSACERIYLPRNFQGIFFRRNDINNCEIRDPVIPTKAGTQRVLTTYLAKASAGVTLCA